MRQLYSIIVILLSFLGIVFIPVQGQFFYDLGQPTQSTPTSDLAQELVTSTIQADSLFVKLMKFFGVYGFTNAGTSTQPAIAYIQYIINMALGLAAFIALIILLYGFYLMFFAKQEEAFDKAKKIIIGVTIALFIMGLAWIVIRFLFYLGTLIQ